MSDGTGRPRVLMVSGSLPPRVCGIADYTACLADALRTEGAHVETVGGSGDAGLVASVAAAIRAERPAVVHFQYEQAIYGGRATILFALTRLLRGEHIPLVTTLHSLDGPRRWGKAHRLALLPLLAGSQSVIVCSDRQRAALSRLPGLGARVGQIPVGNPIPVTAARVETRQPGPPRLVYFGFVWPGRGIETLLQSLVALTYDEPRATLEIIGGGDGSPTYAAVLRSLAASLGITDRVCFRGALPAAEVSRALAGADMVLLPYPTGVSTGRTTVMAALAHGAPVVTMSTPANLSPLFRDGENMLLSPVGDETAFIEDVRRLAADADLRRHLSAGATDLAEAFTWQRIARQTLALPPYRGIVSDK